MAKNLESNAIKRVRQYILNGLNLIYPSAMLLGQLFRTVVANDPTYQWGQFEKDIFYLMEKNYIEFGADCFETPFKKKIAKLTATGKEIADDVLDDPALEI